MTKANDLVQPEIKTHAATDIHSRCYGNTFSTGGLTKREHFAAMAMQGYINRGDLILDRIIPGGEYAGWTEQRLTAQESVEMADLLIAALNKPEAKAA